jgi:hypothetical protein
MRRRIKRSSAAKFWWERVRRVFVAILLLPCGLAPAEAGFRTPESLVRNVFAHYGNGAPDLSHGLPHDDATTQNFFDPSLAQGVARAEERTL